MLHSALRCLLWIALTGPDDVDATVEGVLFDALRKVCLVKDRATAAYSRCGRTDAGVSAFGQVIALNVRSNLTAEAGAAETGFVVKESAVGTATQQALTTDPKPELNYVHTLNRILPDDVLVTAWSPVPIDFNARFSASSRSYKYVVAPIYACCWHQFNKEGTGGEGREEGRGSFLALHLLCFTDTGTSVARQKSACINVDSL